MATKLIAFATFVVLLAWTTPFTLHWGLIVPPVAPGEQIVRILSGDVETWVALVVWKYVKLIVLVLASIPR